MHAIGAAALRQLCIGRDQKNEAVRTAQRGQTARHARPGGRAEMAINDGRASGQAAYAGARIGRSLWVGEKIK
jgi:hypothetical protein